MISAVLAAHGHDHVRHASVHAIVVAHVVVAHAVIFHVALRRGGSRLISWLSAVLLRRRPSVTVVTPTWKRRGLLLNRCVPSVKDQTYDGHVEHVIVSDGPDEDLRGVPGVTFLPGHVPERNRGLTARRHGAEAAQTDLIAYLDDDNAWRRRHLEVLTGALLASGADFAYSLALAHNDGLSWPVGLSPPVFAQIDTSMIVHRRELLSVATWEPSPGPADWDLVKRWLRAGAAWAFVPEITMDYYYPP